MAFGQSAVTSPATSTTTWATASVRSCSARRNRAARSVGAAVAATLKLKFETVRNNDKHSCKVSPFSSGSLSDMCTANSDESDDCMSSKSSVGSIASTSTGSLPGSVDQNQETQHQTSTRKSRRPRSPDHFGRISLELSRKASFKSLRQAFMAAEKDQDGLLSPSDMEEVFCHFQLPSSDANTFFKGLDKNGQGRIWWRETLAILKPILKKGEPSVVSWDAFYGSDSPRWA